MIVSFRAPVEALCLAVLNARRFLALAAALFAQVTPLRELGDEIVLEHLVGLVDMQGTQLGDLDAEFLLAIAVLLLAGENARLATGAVIHVDEDSLNCHC